MGMASVKTLLFTGGGGAGTEALARLLADRYVVHFADADPCAKPPSVAPDRWHVIPSARAEHGLTNTAFVPALRHLCESLGVDVLIPGVDEELRPIAMQAWPCAVLLPDGDFVFAHLDKLNSMRRLAARGIAVPETHRLRPRKGERFWPPCPCVVKPREGRGSRHVAIVESQYDGEIHVVLSKVPPEDYITQELLVGQEYTVTMVADAWRNLRAIVPVRVEHKRGITLRAVTDADPAVMEACRRIHQADPAAGVVNIQVIKAEDGTVKPFEINPRISTTACLAMASGVDIIELVGGQDEPKGLVAFTNGVRLHRSWLNEFR